MQSTDCIGKESDTSGSFLSATEPTTPLYNADHGGTFLFLSSLDALLNWLKF